MAKQNKKIYPILISCDACQTSLYKYDKEGPGKLVKCYLSGITQDYTKGDLTCPKCDQPFARSYMIHGRPAHKIIQGKVSIKGHTGKK